MPKPIIGEREWRQLREWLKARKASGEVLSNHTWWRGYGELAGFALAEMKRIRRAARQRQGKGKP